MFTFENLIKALRNPYRALIFLLRVKFGYFSQAGEDIIVDDMLKKTKGFYVDIGANHPVKGSNTYWFYRKGWNGICVEPNKELIEKISLKRRRDTCLQMGVGKKMGEMIFHTFDANQMSTCDLDTVKRYKKAGHNVTDSYSVPIWPLEKLFDAYLPDNQEIDILSVDVEGWDMDVLESNNWNKYRPNVIILETVEYGTNGKNTWINTNDTFDSYLSGKGYAIAFRTGINTIYKKV